MKVYYRIAIGAACILGAVLFFKLVTGGNIFTLFDPQGAIAGQERDIIVKMVLLMLIIVVPMFVLLFMFAWKYRAGNKGAAYDPEESHDPLNELMLWVIPAVLVAVLAIMNWQSAHALDPYKPIESSAQPLTVQVVALRWKWLFIYPEQHIATVNLLEFPVARPVHFELTADGPISAFWIPQLGSQIYAMAAMQTQLELIASTTGEFLGKDTEINGEGYAGMTFPAKSVTPEDFETWVTRVQATAPAFSTGTYDSLAEPSVNNPPATYASVPDGFFDSVIEKFMGPNGSDSGMMSGMHY